MTPFRLLWDLHKWIGIAIGLFAILCAGTGLLLLVKKDFAWIQPPTQRGVQDAEPAAFRPLDEVFAAVFAHGVPQLQSMADIDRVDFRPARGIHKVRSIHQNIEVQVDAVTLRVWEPQRRRSDWIESLHDGQLLGEWVHGWVMPAVAVLLVVLGITGYAIWIWPKLLKRRRRKAAARSGGTP